MTKVLEIAIIKPQGRESLFAWANGRELFQFEERGIDDGLGRGQWFFWPRGNFNPVKFKGDFPMAYFVNLCKAYAFILGEEEEMADQVVITGKKYITK